MAWKCSVILATMLSYLLSRRCSASGGLTPAAEGEKGQRKWGGFRSVGSGPKSEGGRAGKRAAQGAREERAVTRCVPVALGGQPTNWGPACSESRAASRCLYGRLAPKLPMPRTRRRDGSAAERRGKENCKPRLERRASTADGAVGRAARGERREARGSCFARAVKQSRAKAAGKQLARRLQPVLGRRPPAAAPQVCEGRPKLGSPALL